MKNLLAILKVIYIKFKDTRGEIRLSSERKIKMLTIKEAAQLIEGLTEYRIRQMCINGELPCFMAGKKYLINQNALYKAILGE